MTLRRRASYNGWYSDMCGAGTTILRRAETYLEYGSLVAPGWSTRQFDTETTEGARAH